MAYRTSREDTGKRSRTHRHRFGYARAVSDAAPYRQAPMPETFEIPLGPEASRGLVMLGLTAVLALASAVVSRWLFILLVTGGGGSSVVLYLLSQGPRRIEVHPDRVRVLFAFGGPRELSTADLEVQYLPPKELYLVTRADTVELDPRRLGRTRRAASPRSPAWRRTWCCRRRLVRRDRGESPRDARDQLPRTPMPSYVKPAARRP